jgi:hypothetical protein
MSRQMAGNRKEDLLALIRVVQQGDLPDSGPQHLVGVEDSVFAEHRVPQG